MILQQYVQCVADSQSETFPESGASVSHVVGPDLGICYNYLFESDEVWVVVEVKKSVS